MSPDLAPLRLLDGAVQILALEQFTDSRGSLTPLTLEEFGFHVARAFVITAPRGAVRGGHAHRRVRQVLFRAGGTIDVDVRRGDETARISLDERHPALLIEAGVWAQQTYRDDGATLIVFADGPYEAAEYTEVDPRDDQAAS
ncbi:dTDP-4-dehydrorhamnose 3,5-epimerase [Microbacterium sp. cf046]|uniref:sugar 3,4-ketoisomerase n=1 Tax=Microbacterium sp. cf046 TaxID=1761803 RepID=UPI0008E62EBD|nr:FdtA/QdtA family cupin domain-containing protein [Microbacterium sp. cf046]SFR99298.1 dTDP-4-dehydrorhamnose 3,5-epimerase [Microbacterium sp. cf046]